MPKLDRSTHARHLRSAEAQFKLMTAVRLATTLRTQPLTVPDEWTFGQTRATAGELHLQPDQAERAASFLEHTVTFTLCLAAHQALKDTVEAPRDHQDRRIVAAWEITRLIRNAYAHQPFAPVWNIDPACRGKNYEIGGVMTLNTDGLDGRSMRWQDYGGLLGLFNLSRWIRSEVLGDSAFVAVEAPPATGIHQQGRMTLRPVTEVQVGREVIVLGNNPITLDAPGGPHTLTPLRGLKNPPPPTPPAP